IARRRGSVPELITHGQTGFVCETEDEMAAAVGRLGELDRATCRAEFERRFTVETMTDAYLRIYERVRAGPRSGFRVNPSRRVQPTLSARPVSDAAGRGDP